MTKKIIRILETLEEMYPNAKAELNFHTPFELLIAVVLSAQTTDIQVNKVTKALFDAYPTPYEMMDGDLFHIESLIKTIGLYHTKAKHIKALSKILVEQYDGQVPSKRDALESLPGVGRKTANVVLSNAFNVPALAVDTHVSRVSIRLGIADPKDNVLKIEEKLNQAIDSSYWLKVHHQMIFFGRYHCTAKKPKCSACALYELCTYEHKTNKTP